MKNEKYYNAVNESGEGYCGEDYSNEIQAEKEVRAQIDAEEKEWTLEVTKSRRVLFNNAKPTRQTIAQIQKELGFTMLDLQNAVKRHGL